MWKQSGHFDVAAELKPLLHVWSLSLEEQFYVVLPVTFFFTRPRHWLKVALVVVTVSIALYAYGTSHAQVESHYNRPVESGQKKSPSSHASPDASCDNYLDTRHGRSRVEVLCGQTSCRTQSDGVFLYRDEGHLSVPGSALLGRKYSLSQQSLALAG